MSKHDPTNRKCHLNWRDDGAIVAPACTCLPPADAVEDIRDWLENCFNYGLLVESDRQEANEHFQYLLAELDKALSIIDDLTAENERLKSPVEGIACPFCREDGFDLIGLRQHITGEGFLFAGVCEKFQAALQEAESDE